MNAERAREINGRMSQAYLVLHGIAPGPMPYLGDVSLEDAREACALVGAGPPERIGGGVTRLTLSVSANAVLPTFLGALRAMPGRRGRRAKGRDADG